MEQVRLKLDSGDALMIKTAAATLQKADGEDLSKLVVLVSTDSVDSYGDIIHQGKNEHGAGWMLDRFNKHPAMLWGHDHFEPSLGSAKAYLDTHAQHGLSLFSTAAFDVDDPFAARIAGKVSRGILNETSVGFVSKLDARREDAPHGFDFYEQELIEWSWVNRGANPDVAVMAKSLLGRNPDIAALIHDSEGDDLESLKTQLAEVQAEFDAYKREAHEAIRRDFTVSIMQKAVARTHDSRRELIGAIDRIAAACDSLR